MARKTRSSGLLQYERDADAIGERIKRGEIATEETMWCELLAALERAAPNMTERERLIIQARALSAHGAVAKALAAKGHPVPGNDPNRPN